MHVQIDDFTNFFFITKMLRETTKVLTVINNKKLILMQKSVTKNTDLVVNPQHVIKTTSEHII